MLQCFPGRQMTIEKVEKRGGSLLLTFPDGVEKITPVTDRSLRVQYTRKESFRRKKEEAPGVLSAFLEEGDCPQWTWERDGEDVVLRMKGLTLRIHGRTNSFTYYDRDGRVLLRESRRGSKELEEFPIYAMSEENLRKEYVDTPDGRKEVIREAGRIPAGDAYHTRLSLEFGETEGLYGLGQHEEGYHSLRGSRVYLHQANRKIAIPVLVSTLGYGLMMHTYSPAIFNDTREGSYFYTEADPEMDFFFMNGEGKPDEVIREYRRITGKAALLPRWAFGYLQSQERYETREEILDVAEEYRRRGIGLDCVVLDWCSWHGNEWGQKTFDGERFPDPAGMISELHDRHIRFMLSIWPNMGEDTENLKEFRRKGQTLPGVAIYNALNEEARATYWKQVKEGLFCHGVDAWWCDNSEPFTPEWNHPVRPESSAQYEEYCKTAGYHLPYEQMNVYAYYHALGIYEGQRRETNDKRVVNLTRSGYLGQQRLGTILWSGDIAASWDTFRRQIAAGLHFCASGLPYWTVDIGAFFVKYGMQWFWNGEYDLGEQDPAYCELFVRMYQWGAFLPLFRGHGTDIRRELWKFDQPQAPFFRALLKMNRLRYELMPYIYSYAGRAWAEDGSIIRPLAFGFPGDSRVYDIMDQYLFGEEIMVCPVTEAKFFGEGQDGQVCPAGEEHATREVYLPEGCDWVDFWTDERYTGGTVIPADASLDRIPVFVKSGSIIPRTEFALSTEEQTGAITWHIYGDRGTFRLYEDAGDGYAYEQGEYRLTTYCWSRELGLTADGKEVRQASIVIHGGEER